MYKYLFGLLLLLLCIPPAFAGESAFSFNGYPYLSPAQDVYGSGMGDTGSGDLFRKNLSLANPSLAVTFDKVVFSTAAKFGYINFKNKNGQKHKGDGFNLEYFDIVVPLYNHRVGVQLNSLMAGNYEYETDYSWDGNDFIETNKIESFIYQANIFWALKNNFVNVGLAGNYYFGNRTRFFKQDFDVNGMFDTIYESEQTFKGAGATVGLSKEFNNISLGLAFSSEAKLTGDSSYKSIHDTASLDDGEFKLPNRILAGFTLKPIDRLKGSIDFSYLNYKALDSNEYTSDAFKFGLGVAYEPLWGYGEWYERIPVRAGFYYYKLPFEKNGNEIIEKAATVGITAPIKNISIDFAVNFLQRGNANDNGIEDNAVFFSIGVSGFDVFKKRVKRIKHRDIPKATGK